MTEEKQVLVVDDDHDIAQLIKIVLEFKGYKVTVDNTGREVIPIIQNKNISLIVLDIYLSGMMGTDICRELKQAAPQKNIPVIMISAHPNARELAMDAGADDFLAKPFDIQELAGLAKKLTQN